MRSVKLDWIRCFAGFWVVLFHCSIAYETYVGDSADMFGINFFKEGHSGVTLFYALSGYLISSQIFQGHENITSFIIKRIKKLFPLYYLLTLIFFLLASSRLFPINSDPNWIDLICSTLFIQSSVYGKSPILYVGWSLEYELIFYIIVGLALLTKKPSFALLFFLIILCLCYPAIFLPFLFGTSCVLIVISYKTNLKIFSLLASMFCIFLFQVITGNSFVLISMGLLLCIPDKYMFGDKLAKIFSDSTYSIYLIQVFTIPFFYKFINLSSLPGCEIYIVFLATIFTGLLCYFYIEKKLSAIFYRTANLIAKKINI